ncbi:MAG: phosphoglucosamine mutase [Gemmatimonadota bacterium]
MTASAPSGKLMSGVSGVRGRVGEGLTPEVMTCLAAAHGAALLERARAEASGGRSVSPAVVLGRDSRTSGPMFRDAAVAGLLSVGCDVLDLGLAPTPTVLLTVRLLGALGGIVITASHNPVEWNAAKLVSGRGLFLTREESLRTLAVFESGGPPRVGWRDVGRLRPLDGYLEHHVERILRSPAVDPPAVEARGFRVVLDVCHGVAGLLLEPLLRRLGCRVESLHSEPSGLFPRNPDPAPANLGELEARVRGCRADVGLALDPDGDRLALVSEQGRAVGEDLTLTLAVERVLTHRGEAASPPPPVVTNLSTSRIVEDVAAAHGAEVVRTPVGEIHVAQRMLDLGSVVGGEGNGGVIYPEVHPTRDAGAAAALVLSLLAAKGTGLVEAVAGYPSYGIVKETLGLEADRALDAAALGQAFADASVDVQDGMRFAWEAERAWLHVRRSGTEPIARLIAEAPSRERAQQLVARARQILEPRPTGAAAARG